MPIQIPVSTPSSCHTHGKLTSHPVKLGVDIVRYNEALGKNEPGTNEAREQDLLKRFPPSADITLTKPALLIDAGGRQILWYLPCAMSCPLQVRPSDFSHTWRCLMPHQADMYAATARMSDRLKNGMSVGTVRSRKGGNWRIHPPNFYPASDPSLAPGCINISPCWFQQGREVIVFASTDV
jgi:hypothetical protein